MHELTVAAAVAIFLATYAFVAVGKIPVYHIDRAGAALLGGSLMVAVGALTIDEAYRAIDFDTITLLLGMMIVVANLRVSGFFRLVNDRIATWVHRPLTLLVAIVLASGILSAFLVNDTICLVMTPLVLDLVLRLKRNPVPYLLAVATASNIGSVATITGNPQNIIIGSLSRIPYTTFAAQLAPVAAAGLVLTIALIAIVYREEFLTRDRFSKPPLPPQRYHGRLLINTLLVMLVMVVLFFIGTARTFAGPATTALIPELVPEEHFVNAVTWGATIFQFATIIGPALGGILYSLPITQFVPDSRLEGPGIVYVFCVATLGWSMVLIGSMHTRTGRMEHRALSLDVVLAGFQYMARTPMLLGAASLDLFAVLLGGAVALTPMFANDVLHTGPRGLGLLRAAPAAGAVVMSLLLARYPFQRHAGTRLFICVGMFGAATAVFGASKSLWLSLTALFVAGAMDAISVIIRGSLLQLGTPPEMRGRVSAVNSLFIGASNELGEFESGVTAQWWGAVRATIYGGLGAMVIAGIWAVAFPGLRKADELTVEALRPDLAKK